MVSTPDEVFLCALAQSTTDPSDHSANSALELVATTYAISTDNVRILSIVGTESGRIFLGGNDGSVQEMTYALEQTRTASSAKLSVDEQLNLFYDGDEGAMIPEVINDESNDRDGALLRLGKRTWSTISGDNSTRRASKCAKVNCTDSAPMALKAIVPDFVLRQASSLFGIGSMTGGGSINQMVVDEARDCLYTLSTTGWICAFALNTSTISTQDETVNLAAAMDGVGTTRLYLESVARNQGFPPTSHNRTIGFITFPGGGASAQAGVGGMDGARAILKIADSKANERAGIRPNDILKPISIHVVSPTESNRITLVAVTKGGLRLYLSSLLPGVIANGPEAVAPPRYSARPARNPYAPHNRLTLCHVRSSPPSSRNTQDFAADATGGVVGSLLPRVQGKLAKVSASVYDEGVFVAAVACDTMSLRSTGANNGDRLNAARRQQQRQAGDTVFAACMDVLARKVEAASSLASISQNGTNSNVLTTFGGITESVTFPLSSLDGRTTNDTVLPGGIVYAMAVKSRKENTVMKLTMNSNTPSESELGAGFVPAFFPLSEPRTRDLALSSPQHRGSVNGGTLTYGTSTAIVPKSTDTNMEIIWKVLTNIVLSRPVQHGLTYQSPLENGKSTGHRRKKNYRVSKRSAAAGFSDTASEGLAQGSARLASASPSTTNTQRNLKAARLRKGLLQPCTVPLGYLSSQYYSQPKEMVALNSQGLHYFHFVPVLSSFADALIAAGDGVDGRSTIDAFFEAYGYNEACAMSLGLAVAGDHFGITRDQVKQRAKNAAMARALAPKLLPLAETGTGHFSTGITTATDPWVPLGYEFRASALSEGVTNLCSRLLRPIWHKLAVVVTEGRSVKSRWSTKTYSSPAKVELLLDEKSLEEIAPLLRNLMLAMRSLFARAIKVVPGITQQQQVGMLGYNGTSNGDNFLTRALQHSSQVSSGSDEMVQHWSPQQIERRAQLIEEKNLHSLYRVLSRVVQLLDLLSLLWRAQRMADLREIDWGLLHGFTFAQLVQTLEGQDRLESLLNSLVTSSASGRSHAPVTSAQADQLAKLFAEQCYLFFSPGSRYAYMGLRKAYEGLQQPLLSSSRASFLNQAAENLLQAAYHWHSAPLVTGRILHTKGKESYEMIAAMAFEFGSPVASAAQALMDLGDVSTVVTVCLTTAANFIGDRTINRRKADFFTDHHSNELAWEKDLYHARRDDAQQNGTSFSSRSPTSQSSSTKAYGADVTAQDAVETCYAIIFYHLSSLLDNNSDLSDQMVEACSASEDKLFLEAFFTHLLKNNHAETLLRINIPALDDWLKERGDAELLWRYYDVQKRYMDAGQLALKRANDAIAQLSLSERIDWLSRSVSSFIGARDEQHVGRFEMAGSVEMAKMVEDTKDTLRIAKIQSRILASIDSTRAESLSPELREKLSSRLILVSELFNGVAANLDMYEECLLILHACRHDEIQTIETLWKNILCEQIIPCGTRDQATYRFLESFVADVGFDDGIKFIQTDERVDSLPLFENTEWKDKVAQRVVALGQELLGTGADYVVPISFLLSNLEGTLGFRWRFV